jgi:hypothetical protein
VEGGETVKYLVWKHGEKRTQARLVEALHHQHAAAEAHACAGGPPSEAYLFVQLAEGDEGKQDRRVRVFFTELVMEPVVFAYESRKVDLVLRCHDCGELALKVGTLVDGQCAGCGAKAWRGKAACA